MPREDEMAVPQKASSVAGIKVPEKQTDEPVDGDNVKCYVNGRQAEVKDKWEFINEVANSIPEFNNYMGSCAGAGSGDFHMYRAFRRKEAFRLNAMRRDDFREKKEKQWQQQHDAVQNNHEDEVNKKRDKRKAKQARQKAGKKAKLDEEKATKAAARGDDLTKQPAAGEQDEPQGQDVADQIAENSTAGTIDFTTRSMNVNAAVDKAHEGLTFTQLCELPPSALQGLASWADVTCSKLRIRNIKQLGTWKYHLWARAIAELAERETDGGREEASTLNMNCGLDKEHENKSLKEIVELPPSALQGLAEHSDADLAKLRVKTVKQLGDWKYARWAAAIVACAALENEDINKSS